MFGMNPLDDLLKLFDSEEFSERMKHVANAKFLIRNYLIGRGVSIDVAEQVALRSDISISFSDNPGENEKLTRLIYKVCDLTFNAICQLEESGFTMNREAMLLAAPPITLKAS